MSESMTLAAVSVQIVIYHAESAPVYLSRQHITL